MKRSFSFRFLTWLAAGSLALIPVYADVVELKSGEKIEGKILSEDADSISIEYNITQRIKDTKSIKKSDIAKMTKLSPSQAAYLEQGLDKVLPSSDLLTAADYESLIQDKLRPFIANFAGTEEAKVAEKAIVTLNEEKEKVLAGELKMEGQWLNAETAKADTFNIEAYRHRIAMNQHAKTFTEENILNTLKEYDKLRKNYPASSQFISATEEVVPYLTQYEQYLLATQRDQPFLSEKREAGLRGMSAADAAKTKESIDKEKEALKERITLETKAGERWLPIDKYDAKSIATALQTVDKAKTEIKGYDLASLQRENVQYGSILRAIALEKEADATRLYSAITPDKIISKESHALVGNKIKELSEELKKRGAVRSSNIDPTKAMGGAGEAAAAEDQNNPLAIELKKAQEKKAQEAKEAAEKKAAAEKAAADAAAAAAAAAAAQEEGIMAKIQENILPIGGGIVVILLLSLFLGKKKKQD